MDEIQFKHDFCFWGTIWSKQPKKEQEDDGQTRISQKYDEK